MGAFTRRGLGAGSTFAPIINRRLPASEVRDDTGTVRDDQWSVGRTIRLGPRVNVRAWNDRVESRKDFGKDGTEAMSRKFRKKPVVIEAMLHDGTIETARSICEWAKLSQTKVLMAQGDRTLVIPTLEGQMRADPGDWIIRGVKGEYYPCKPDIFEATYEPVEQS